MTYNRSVSNNLKSTSASERRKSHSGRSFKVHQVIGDLHALARARGPGEKMPTTREMQVLLGTTSATLTSAMDRLEASGIIRRVHAVGVFVSPHLDRRNVALVCNPAVFSGPSASPFWGALLTAMQEQAVSRSVAFSLHFAVPTAGTGDLDGSGLYPALQADLEAGRIDGVLGIALPHSTVEWLRNCGVALATYSGWAGQCHVVHHNGEFLRLAVGALAEQGCRRIGLWEPFRPVNSILAELWAHTSVEPFRSALEAHRLDFDPHLVQNNYHLLGHYLDADARPWHPVSEIPIIESGPHQGYLTARRVFCGDDVRPDGIVIMEDNMTMGALLGLQEAGIRPGRDVRIVTHANRGVPMFVSCRQELTVVEYDLRELVTALFEAIGKLMNGDAPSEPMMYIRPRIRR